MPQDEVPARLNRLAVADRPEVTRFDQGAEFRDSVALLPSAFNPLTYAHLGLLETGAQYGQPAALLSTRNVDKHVHGAPLVDRVRMLLAASDDARFAVLATNAARLVDQARALRNAHTDIEFTFVVGFDTLVRIFDARYYDDMAADLGELFAHHRLVAANRGDASTDAVSTFIASSAAAPFADRIAVAPIHVDQSMLSSSEARRQLESHGTTGIVPAEVAEYIARRGLYRPA